MMPTRCIPCALTQRSPMPTGSAWAVFRARTAQFTPPPWMEPVISTLVATLRSSEMCLPPTSPNGTGAVGPRWARGMNNAVLALAVPGNEVYAGGYFTNAGGIAADYIAKWDGSSWTALGSGMNGAVFALAVLGGDVYAGVYF